MTTDIDYANPQELISNNKSFCILPWMHLYTFPSGTAYPCCVSKVDLPVGSTRKTKLIDIVNSDSMNQLRLDMLAGRKNPNCETCYQHEETGIQTMRQGSTYQYFKHFKTDVVDNTNEDGSVKNFKMRYFDIRFSNICNFKCRTCGPDFSSQWEQEYKKNQIYVHPIHKNDRPEFLGEVLEHMPTIETAYFAGGEPLITEEHYKILEELIRLGRTDVELRYNTNLSVLKFKDKDLISLWKYFTKPIDIAASIDHYGIRAEYIRHGTEWAQVENNFRSLREHSFIKITINSVLSVFNVLTIEQFYNYLIKNGLYTPKDRSYSIYKMVGPSHLSAQILPSAFKDKAEQSLNRLIALMEAMKFDKPNIEQIKTISAFLRSRDCWEEEKHNFRKEVKLVDELRGEKFTSTFPEIADLMWI